MKKHHILILILSISSFSHAQDVEEVVTSALADPSQIEIHSTWLKVLIWKQNQPLV